MATTDMLERDIVMSVRPIYASKIVDGIKTVELRRRFTKGAATGTVVLIYSSSPVQAIVGYAQIKEVHCLPIRAIWQNFSAAACINRQDFDQYFSGVKYGNAIVLENARRFNKCIEIADLQANFDFVPPQSFRYLGTEFLSLLRDERLQIPYRH